MILSRFFIVFFIFMIHSLCHSQEALLYEDSFLETSTDLEKFSIYLDSIEKYLYRDADLTTKAFLSCQHLLDNGFEPNDSLLFLYTMNQVLQKHTMLDQHGAYKIFIDNVDF